VSSDGDVVDRDEPDEGKEITTKSDQKSEFENCLTICTGIFLKLLTCSRLRASPLRRHRRPLSAREFCR
jgi:hypothetical protein